MTILSKMEEAGIISSFDGKNSRKILVKSVSEKLVLSFFFITILLSFKSENI